MRWKIPMGLALIALLPVALSAADPELEQSLAAIAEELGRSMTANGVHKLAVVQFSDLAGYESALGLFIAEELTTHLFSIDSGRFDIVERQHLRRVLEEQKLTSSSLFEPEAIEKLGQILGIDAIVTGSIADLGASMKINARAISVSSAKVFAASSARFLKDEVAENLVRQGAAPDLSGASAPIAPAAIRTVQASDVFFQNDLIRITVQDLSLTQNAEYGTLAFELENLTTQHLLLAVELDSGRCQVVAVDNRGNEYRTRDLYQKGISGLTCLEFSTRRKPSEAEFSIVGPKSRTTVVVPLVSSDRRRSSSDTADRAVTGRMFSFALNLLWSNGGRVSRISAGISNVRPSG